MITMNFVSTPRSWPARYDGWRVAWALLRRAARTSTPTAWLVDAATATLDLIAQLVVHGGADVLAFLLERRASLLHDVAALLRRAGALAAAAAAAVAVQSTLAPPDVRGSMLAAISSSSAGLDVPPATLAAMATGLMFL